MTADRKDVGWLTERVVDLFEDASGSEGPDHAVCVKYAELLYKLLPKAAGGGSAATVSDLDEIRKVVMADRKAASGREESGR